MEHEAPGEVDRAHADDAQASKRARETTGSPRQGNFARGIPIGEGRKLYLQCAGRGRPTVILESGIHDSSDVWTRSNAKPPVVGSPTVFRGVGRFTHVCMYDRPGTIRYTNPPALTTRSSPAAMPRTLHSMVGDLHALLHKAGVPRSIPARRPLLRRPDRALLRPEVPARGSRHGARRCVRHEHQTAVRATVVARRTPPELPGTPLENDPGWETVDAGRAIEAINNAKLPRMPLAVISKTEPFATAPGTPKDLKRKLEHVWPQVQSALVNLEPLTPHIFATGSDHYVEINDQDLTISVIKLILDRARHGGTG
jgi:hypothetical protein